MKLRHLEIKRLPGIDRKNGFSLPEIGDGIQIIVGPNGIGKSSVGRAFQALIWPSSMTEGAISVAADFEGEDGTLEVERDGRRIEWTDAHVDTKPPSLPPEHLRHCFVLRLPDLLNATDPSVQDFSKAIHRQLSGGYDLALAQKEGFSSVTKSHGKKQAGLYDTAAEAIGDAGLEQGRVLNAQAGLESLQRQIADAETAQTRLLDVATAIERAEKLTTKGQLEASLVEMPAGMDRVTGKEREDIDGYLNDIELKRQEKQTSEGHLRTHSKTIGNTGLTSELNAQLLEDLALKVDELTDLGLKIDGELGRRKSEAEAALRSAQKTMGLSDHAILEGIELADVETLLNFLKESEELDRSVGALEERIRLLEEPEDETPTIPLAPLEEGRRQLLRWLRSPTTNDASDISTGRSHYIVGAIAIAVGVVGAFIEPLLVSIAAFGLGVLALGLFGKKSSSSNVDLRKLAREDYEKIQKTHADHLGNPESWDEDGVEGCLNVVDAGISETKGRISRLEARGYDLRGEKSKLQNHKPDIETRDQDRLKLFGGLGLDLALANTDLVVIARYAFSLNEANAAFAIAEGHLSEAEADYGMLIGAVNGVLADFDVGPSTTHQEAASRVTALKQRNADFSTANMAKTRERENVTRIAAELNTLGQRLAQVYQDAGLADGDDVALKIRMDVLPNYQQISDQIHNGTIAIDQDTDRLNNGLNDDLIDLPMDALVDEQETLEVKASMLGGLNDQRIATEQNIKRLSQGHELEHLIRHQDMELEKLNDQREEALLFHAGDFLLGQVKQEHQQTQLPAVFSRAQDLFSTFTSNLYELLPPEGDAADGLRARSMVDNSTKALNQLSDGTRSQLLLAAKIAYAEHAESGNAMPFFLDEALVQSDPDRYSAIIRNLGMVSRDTGRQIFYLTCDPQEIGKITAILGDAGLPAPGTIDLAAIRKVSRGVADFTGFSAPTVLELPAPNGMDAVAYAGAIKAPPFDPAGGANAQHLIYLLWDDLAALHKLMALGQNHAGQWELLSGSALAQTLGDEFDSVRTMDDRLRLLKQFTALASIGQGHSVDRNTLEASGAITPKYIDGIAEICADVKGDGEALMATLDARKDPRMKGFRKGSVEGLGEYLEAEGYIDTREPLSADIILSSLLTSAEGGNDPELAKQLTSLWISLGR
jgi:DNA repair protein SbcC/Rad50